MISICNAEYAGSEVLLAVPAGRSSVGDAALPPAARSRAATQKGLFLRHSRKRGNPVRQYRSLGSRFRGNDGKGFLNSCLLNASWKRPPALPCGSDACREGALQRETFAGHSQNGSLRNPSRLTPLPQMSAMQRTHAKQTSVGATEGFRPPAARLRAATQKGLFLRHSRGSGNPVRHHCSLGSRLRGNDGKGFLNRCFWMLHGSGRQPSPVGATRVAKARSSAKILRAIRRRCRFATLRGLRRSPRRVQCSVLTRSNQASVPP
jgi:hypothetical protein